MNTEQSELYERIRLFSLDQPDAPLSFSKRLARDNGWSFQYAQQAIEEYKKFAFLAVVAGHPVTPSDQVDQVWHLHLTYTRSYWEVFCSQVLKTPLHHEPTRGGRSENQKFDDWYRKTLESYECFFETVPPLEIWPMPKDRFGRDLHFVRVNTQRNWVLPKLTAQNLTMASLAIPLTLILSGCYVGSVESHSNPLGEAILAVICVVTGFGVVQFLVGLGDAMKNPSSPNNKGVEASGGLFGCAGCGHLGDQSSSDASSSDGGGCGGGGCGGGGCGGGGCGGGGGGCGG